MSTPSTSMPERIGHFRLLRKLGEGGMGVVYAAHDERLDRPVALKMIGEAMRDEEGKKRLWREARAAASVSHPNICQLYEVGEEEGELFIAMELLDGESLADRIKRGPANAPEAIQIGLGILAALEALHGRGLVHRDLKPSNVFLTPHGAKLLDFGLARPARPLKGADDSLMTRSQLTLPGAVIGTPRYMAPEQVEGGAPDLRTDLFAVGAILFETLSGQPPFSGATMVEVLYATLHEQPPALTGSPLIAAVDRVIRRALTKSPEERYPTASAMAEELRAALLVEDTGPVARARVMTRLIVLPFRVLRPDPETDFLAFSLPDAITSSLSGLSSLVVRSSVAASGFASERPDLKRIAVEADVDVVLTGTLLRAGDQLRVSTQLVEAPGGTLLWSHTSQVSLRDIFQVQDDLVQRIVESLSLPLTAREHKLLKHDVPATAKAYEFYLRANQLGLKSKHWHLARDLYLQCLAEDPRYAPAWARLGRIYRLIAKYAREEAAENLERAEGAFKRALELNPDLSVAHNLYAQFEVEAGRPQEALLRLLKRAQTQSADPELFSGLVHVCRYCGLLDASLAAHRQARRLDPAVRTSVSYTYWMLGDYERAVGGDIDDTPFMRNYALASLGRLPEAIQGFGEIERRTALAHTRDVASLMRAALEGNREESIEACRRIVGSSFRDPEGLFFVARTFAYVGEPREALELLERVVEGGFFCFPALARDPWLDPLRTNPEFTDVLRWAEARHREALTAFTEAGGDRVLAISSRT